MKVSFITTVLNEERNILAFLKSLVNQTDLPDEIIITDGGSKDKTVEKIKEFKKENPQLNIEIYQIRGNRSLGRNQAIIKAKNEIIVVSDSGCVLDKDWLRNLKSSFKKGIDVVSGFYLPKTKNVFQKCLAAYTCFKPERLDKEYLPSSRSIAFTKGSWKKVGGYPENLDTCEDLVFAKRLKDYGFKFALSKDAIVYWPQKETFWQAFFQFFNYAKGDGQAHYFRTQTPFLFLRIIVGMLLIVYAFIVKKVYFDLLLVFLFLLYLVWSIEKNYKYVQGKKAIYLLPALQVISDIAVFMGTTAGYIKSLFSKKNSGLLIILIIYVFLMLLVINFGIPGITHPFPYNMDEWHQLQAVRDLFKYGTNNIEGAAHGPVFQFFLTGIYLVPFTILKIINPSSVSSSISNLVEQQRIFEILRINTLIFGGLSIIVLWKTVRNYFKINPIFPIALFTFSPIWLSLSNYFKYDIALIFWIILSFFTFFKYFNDRKTSTFILSAIFSALAFATKVSGAIMLPILIFSFFLFTPMFKKHWKRLILGFVAYILVFVMFGIPDLIFLGKGNYYVYFHDNIVTSAQLAGTINEPWYFYIPLIHNPLIFGFSLYLISIFSFGYLTIKNIIVFLAKKAFDRKEIFIIFSFVVFLISLVPLRFAAAGNRSLILLPIFAILISILIKDAYRKINKKIFLLIFLILFIVQFYQSFPYISFKMVQDSREASSVWIMKNIRKKTIIGLENTPVYQGIPNLLLYDFYKAQSHQESDYLYELVDSHSKNLPDLIVLTNVDFNREMIKSTSQSGLVDNLKNNNFKLNEKFTEDLNYFPLVSNSNDLFFAGLIPMSSIYVYEK